MYHKQPLRIASASGRVQAGFSVHSRQEAINVSIYFADRDHKTPERAQGCNLLVRGLLIKLFGHSDAVVLVHEGVIDG